MLVRDQVILIVTIVFLVFISMSENDYSKLGVFVTVVSLILAALRKTYLIKKGIVLPLYNWNQKKARVAVLVTLTLLLTAIFIIR